MTPRRVPGTTTGSDWGGRTAGGTLAGPASCAASAGPAEGSRVSADGGTERTNGRGENSDRGSTGVVVASAVSGGSWAASGISTALMTTVLGLCVAIPTTLLHAIVNQRSRSIIHILDEQSAGIVAQHAEESGEPVTETE